MISLKARLGMSAAVAFGGLALLAAPASAQATRTFVSGVGDDANPCSRTAPCRTWAGAISKTAAGGEMDCLDPGGFGAVTITKSMTIICDYSDGGILVAGQNGIIVNDIASNAPGTVHVVIRGLNIEGLGNSTTSPGIRGIWFVSGASLTVEKTTIRGFRDSTNGWGIAFTPSGPAKLNVNNVTISSSGTGGVGGGILVQPTGASGSASVSINDVNIVNNAGSGIRVDATGNTSAAGSFVSIEDSVILGSNQGIVAVAPASSSTVSVQVHDTAITGASNTGILANGATVTVRVGNATISGNNRGLAAGNSAQLLSYGTNRVDGNTLASAFTGAATQQ